MYEEAFKNIDDVLWIVMKVASVVKGSSEFPFSDSLHLRGRNTENT